MADVPLAITGSTGRLGGRVAARLAEQGQPLRLLVRDVGRAPTLPGATAHQAGYDDAEAVRHALDGVATVFMVSGAEHPDRVQQHRTFIDAAAAAGVEHVVYTSFFGAAADATFTLARDHWATEEHLRASTVRTTILRDNLYLDLIPLFGGEDGVIRGPAGDGRVAAVAIDDIADAAVAVLLEPHAHRGQTYELTGPEALSLAEAAQIVTRATGRLLTYVAETVQEAYASRAAYGAPDWQVDAWVSTYTAVAAGEMERMTDDIAGLTGRPALSLSALLARGGASR